MAAESCALRVEGRAGLSLQPSGGGSDSVWLSRNRTAASTRWLLALTLLGWFVRVLDATAGDADPIYRSCVERCERTGQVGDLSFWHCRSPFDGDSGDNGPGWYTPELLYGRWKQWSCMSDCRYHCVVKREREREELGLEPVKYHGRWPHRRAAVFQETISTVLPALNLVTQFYGWLSFSLLLYHELPSSSQAKNTRYQYAGLCHIYALLAMNAWFWSTICHFREFDLTEKLDYSSAVALVGYSLILSILRTFDLRNEPSRVMVASPVLGFVMTHICYLNFAELDYGLNMKVCGVMATAQLLLWSIWAGVRRHPARFKLWAVCLGGGVAMVLETHDFPPREGYLPGAHTLWHATAVPLTYLWWSFVMDDAQFQASAALVNKAE